MKINHLDFTQQASRKNASLPPSLPGGWIQEMKREGGSVKGGGPTGLHALHQIWALWAFSPTSELQLS